MTEANQISDSRSVGSPPEIRTPSEAIIPGEILGRRRGKICRALGKATKKIFKRSKDSRCPDPVISNISPEGASSTPNIEVQDALSGVERGADPRSALRDAGESAGGMNLLSEHEKPGVSTAQNAQTDLEAAYNFQGTYLQPLRIFDSVIGKLADVHPYAKMALSVLSWAAKIVLDQADRDEAILGLLQKMGEVYDFIADDKRLHQISSMRAILGQISQQTIECAHFIRDYSETKNFWRRLGKNVVTETDDAVRGYSGMLDKLMDNFQKQVIRDVAIYVHRTGKMLELSGMTYARGAGLDTGKQCLPETRTTIISEITDWVHSTGNDVPRVLWLSGPAGTGKSAIAHTIAKWFKDAGGLGSCYCFDRQQKADHRHEKIFSTIARDLADRDPELRRALVDAVEDASSLEKTTDIIQQWDEFIMKPLRKLSWSTIRPIVIVIDALDESGGVETRRRLLRILAGKLGVQRITELPANLRIIVTSRPLRDIKEELRGAQHIQPMSMDDISLATAEGDIHTYISKELEGLLGFGDGDFAALAKKADGLFEWARLACEYIRSPPAGLTQSDSFNAVVSRDHAKQEHLLYDMYDFILTEIMRKDKHADAEFQQTRLAKFRSVMGQILGTAEPLPLNSLNAMRSRFPNANERYEVQIIVGHMGPLLSGTTNPITPIRPLHSSFAEFLTGPSCNQDFLVDVSKVQRDLAFASLHVMKHGLDFNICDLKSSYLPNYEDLGLSDRVETSISPYLSYTCRFWASHVRAADFDKELAEEIRLFLNHERLLFWLEVLALKNAIGCAITALPTIARWLKDHSGFEDVSSTAMDVQTFVQIFRGIISHSTPHLYVSALPFSPVNSEMSRKFAAKFPNTLRLASGHAPDWTAIQNVLRGHTAGVESASISPDGTRIAAGLGRTIRLWDTVTGEQVGGSQHPHPQQQSNMMTASAADRQNMTATTKNSLAAAAPGASVQGFHSVQGQQQFVGYQDTQVGQNLAQANPMGGMAPLASPAIGEPMKDQGKDVKPMINNNTSGTPEGSPHNAPAGPGHGGPSSNSKGSAHGTALLTPNTINSSITQSPAPNGTSSVPLASNPTSQPQSNLSDLPLKFMSSDFIQSITALEDLDPSTFRTNFEQGFKEWFDPLGVDLPEESREHRGHILSVSFSPDRTRIVTGSTDRTVRLWDAATRNPLGAPFYGHTDKVSSVSFSPDATRIVTGSHDNTIRMWDAATGQRIGETLKGHTDMISSVSFSPDRTRIVTGSIDTTIRLWDAETRNPLGEPFYGHTDTVSSVSFSPDATRIVSGSDDRTIRLWDAATGQPVGEPMEGHTDTVSSVSFSPDGTRIVSGSDDHTIRLWDAATGQPVGEPMEGHTGVVFSVSFSPDGTRIVSGSDDETVRLWDAGTGQPLGEPLEGHTAAVSSVSFSPGGTRIVSGSGDYTIRLWDAATGQPVGEPMEGHTGVVSSVSFSPDGTRIVSGSGDETVRLWDAGTGQPLGEPLEGHTDSVLSVSFLPNGTRVISGSHDDTFRLWDAATGQPVGEPLEGHTAAVSSVSFSPDGTRIISGSHDNTIRLWDAATVRPVGEPLEGHTDAVSSVSFSPGGTRIVSGSDDHTIRLWDAATGQPVGEPLRGHTDPVSSVSFSPDGTLIVSASKDGTVRLWDVATGQPLGEPLRGHLESVSSVSFSPDGTRIVSASKDGTVRLWDATLTQNDQIIRFSSNSTHALQNPAELITSSSHHDRRSTSFSLGVDGWILGPNRQLLFWVPLGLRQPFYTPRTVLVIPRGNAELDLSRMAHGENWRNCRDAPTQG